MTISRVLLYPSLLTFLCLLASCGGGYNLDGDPEAEESDVTLSISLASYELTNIHQAVIRIESLIFKKEGKDDITVDTFSSADLGDENSGDLIEANKTAILVNLASTRTGSDIKITDTLTLKSGTYSSIDIILADASTDQSYVRETADGAKLQLNTSNQRFTLKDVEIKTEGNANLVLDIDLRQTLSKNETAGTYSLAASGGRAVGASIAASIIGTADVAAIQNLETCTSKADKAKGNRVYLYEGNSISRDKLQDMNNTQESNSEKAYPYAVAPVAADGKFSIRFINPGSYTMAYSCLAEEDKKTTDDSIQIPSPNTQYLSFNLGDDHDKSCQLPIVNSACTEI